VRIVREGEDRQGEVRDGGRRQRCEYFLKWTDVEIELLII
jgi:hypothetical protein